MTDRYKKNPQGAGEGADAAAVGEAKETDLWRCSKARPSACAQRMAVLKPSATSSKTTGLSRAKTSVRSNA